MNACFCLGTFDDADSEESVGGDSENGDFDELDLTREGFCASLASEMLNRVEKLDFKYLNC